MSGRGAEPQPPRGWRFRTAAAPGARRAVLGEGIAGTMRVRVLLAALLLLGGAAFGRGARAAEGPRTLPATPCGVTIDGDPREAFLLGGAALPAFEATTGDPDGSIRAFLLATPEGLYAALLSTEPPAAGPLRRPAWRAPQDAVLGDWMGLRLEDAAGGGTRVLVLTAGGRSASLGPDGTEARLAAESWAGMDRRFGHTWAGEWLVPWEVVGVAPGQPFRAALLRGRKLEASGSLLEVLSSTASGVSAGRWGAAPALWRRPGGSPAASSLRALAPFDVRPFIPPGEGAPACEDAVPAGEVATAWLELPPSESPRTLEVKGAPEGAELFRVDFWWQAGSREEQDALFPVRVARGAGDLLVAERLLPLAAGDLRAGPLPARIYARMRVPLKQRPGVLTLAVRVLPGTAEIPWRITVVPPLPPSTGLAGIYYMEGDPARWPAALDDMAAHGFTAVTCPAREQAGWERFRSLAKSRGLDGFFALFPDGLTPPSEGAWAYAADEPAGLSEVRAAAERAKQLRQRGFWPWAALCWPPSARLLGELAGVALTPGFPRSPAAPLPPGRTWIYFQGLRENPDYHLRMTAGVSRGEGLQGFWVFCYTPSRPETGDDWESPPWRFDSCKAPDGAGGWLDTVQWESLREGILVRRLLEALEGRGAPTAELAPGLEPSREGRYWVSEGGLTPSLLKSILTTSWARQSS